MTTKLIQELVGLCVEKKTSKVLSVSFDNGGSLGVISIQIGQRWYKEIFINSDSAPQQLQAAIEKVKAL